MPNFFHSLAGAARCTVVILTGLLAVAPPLTAQASSGAWAEGSAPDSADARAQAEAAQAEFERARIRYSPRAPSSYGGRCDETVGRMCLRFDSDGPADPHWSPPVEDPRITEARSVLIAALGRLGRVIPGDPWILGQRVVYVGESGEWAAALEIARGCELSDRAEWWCDALEGVAQHHLGRFAAAHRAFDVALAAMPSELRDDWTDLRPIVDGEIADGIREAEGSEALTARLWALADPLFLVSGRDRETEHYSRWVLAHARDEARNPYRMTWSDDLSEVLVRYGPAVFYERDPGDPLRPTPAAGIGHHDPRAWHVLPGVEQFLAPVAVEPGSWSTDRRATRSYYAPPYAPTVQAIEVQRARFRRGEDLFVVVGWQARDEWTGVGAPPFAPGPGGLEPPGVRTESEQPGPELRRGLFLVPADRLEDPGHVPEPVGEIGGSRFFDTAERPPGRRPGDDPSTRPRASGTAVARVPLGDYLFSLELMDEARRMAWRERHGIELAPLPRGVVALSDLLLLEPAPSEAAGPDRLERHLDRVIPGRSLPAGPVELVWEVYGLDANAEELRFRVAAEPAERGLLRRAGDFLRITDGPPRTQVEWSEGADSDGVAGLPLLRRVVMDLSSLPPGPTRLTLSLQLPGRTPTTAETVIQLRPASSAIP